MITWQHKHIISAATIHSTTVTYDADSAPVQAGGGPPTALAHLTVPRHFREEEPILTGLTGRTHVGGGALTHLLIHGTKSQARVVI